MRPRRRVWRITPHRKGWRVHQGRTRAYHGRQSDAIASARAMAKREWARRISAQVVVHGRDGQVRLEWTYGRDPRRSKG